MNVTYNINNPRALNLGQQYDHNVKTVTFTGFTPVDETNTVYLKFEGLGLYPLSNMAFVVGQSFTLRDGVFQGQLFELAGDGSLVQNSNTFKMMIKPSLAEDTEIVAEDTSISLWFNEMSNLYNEVLDAYEHGMMISAQSITTALGYTPADEAAVPTKVSELENDASYVTVMDSEDIVQALGYTPANEEDIPTVPENISAFNNDSGYITNLGSQDIIDALGYTPVNTDDMADYITGITAEDIATSLGYTPADSADIPTEVSALENDAGYITGVTPQDIIDALGYMPSNVQVGNYEVIKRVELESASNSVVLSANADDTPFSLDGITVVIQNDSGIQGGTNGYMYTYDAEDNVVGGMPLFFYGGASVAKSVLEVEIRGGIVEMHSIGWTSAAPNSPNNKSLIGESAGAGRIAKVEVIGNGQALRAGTVITLYGYKATEDESSEVIVSAGDFELVKTVNVSTSSNSVIINTDSDSNTFSLPGVAVLMSNANGIQGGTNGYINIYDANDNVIGGMQYFFTGGTSITDSVIKFEIRGGIVEIESIGWSSRTPYSPTIKSLFSELGDAGSIAKIEIIGNGYAINAGTTIKVYGVKS